MKSRAVAVPLALILTAGFLGAAAAPFSVSIRPQHESVLALHDDIILDITLTNTSGKLLTLVVYPTNQVNTIEVTGPDGQPRPLTDMGKAIVRNAPKSLAAGQIAVGHYYPEVQLLPRQTFKEVIEISRMVPMYIPRTYSVRLHRRIPEDIGEGEVVSNSVNVNVLYNPVVEKYPFPCLYQAGGCGQQFGGKEKH